MEISYVALIGGSILSALVGLAGIWVTKRENTPILDILSPDELKSYRITRLVQSGISWCTLGKHEFRPGPKESTTVCRMCLPPDVSTQVIERAVGQAKEGRSQPWNRRTYAGRGQGIYTPLWMQGFEFTETMPKKGD